MDHEAVVVAAAITVYLLAGFCVTYTLRAHHDWLARLYTRAEGLWPSADDVGRARADTLVEERVTYWKGTPFWPVVLGGLLLLWRGVNAEEAARQISGSARPSSISGGSIFGGHVSRFPTRDISEKITKQMEEFFCKELQDDEREVLEKFLRSVHVALKCAVDADRVSDPHLFGAIHWGRLLSAPGEECAFAIAYSHERTATLHTQVDVVEAESVLHCCLTVDGFGQLVGDFLVDEDGYGFVPCEERTTIPAGDRGIPYAFIEQILTVLDGQSTLDGQSMLDAGPLTFVGVNTQYFSRQRGLV